MTIQINGTPVALPEDPRISLLDLLRDHLALSGTKKGCNQGACGACTVLVDGQRILSCLALAVQFEGRSITTIEGLATPGELHPLQQAFIEHDGFQCGYCTPGQICSAVGMIDEIRRGVPSHVTAQLEADTIPLDAEELKERMSGNLCRCGAHNGIVDAIMDVYAGGAHMTPFGYTRAATAEDAVRQGALTHARYLGGGTNLVDLMRETIEKPAALVDVTGLSAAIEASHDGGVLLGAAARNTAVAEHRLVRTQYPALARAIVAGASAQIRNMATLGGNLLQRTRCPYFYDKDGSSCNKRQPGQGCDAIHGFNRGHAVLGASPSCVAVHPSDMAVALAAFDAVVEVRSGKGDRSLPLTALHRLPGDAPDRDTTLEAGDLITGIRLPALGFGGRSTYRKVRDRASYAFALVSVAAAIDIRDGRVEDVRLALGGVAHKPWRALKAEDALRGKPADEATFLAAAEAELADARPLRDNGFKVELARRTIAAVLAELAGGQA